MALDIYATQSRELANTAPFPAYPIPVYEEDRLRSLERALLLDTASDEHLDRITTLASETLGTPIALISLVDADRQWFLAKVGLEAEQTPRNMAFCAHAITQDEELVINDALLDPRFSTNPLVVEDPRIRFYAGAQLRAADGQPLGTLCVIDRTPHVFTAQHRRWLRLFAGLVEREADIRQRLARCPVTGLFNRDTFLTLAQKEFERSRRTGGTMALLVLQLLNAGQIRAATDPCDADRPLRDLATGLAGFCRPADLAGRLAEGVYALLLVNPEADRLAAVEKGLQAGADDGGLVPGFPWAPRFAIGGTWLVPGDLSAADLIIRADNALLLATEGDSDTLVTVLGD